MSTVRRITQRRGWVWKLGSLRMPGLVFCWRHGSLCSESAPVFWVLLRGITTVIARALRCTGQVCILDHRTSHRTDSVFLLWFLLPEPWFHYVVHDGLELLSLLPPPTPMGSCLVMFQVELLLLITYSPKFRQKLPTTALLPLPPSGVLHMFRRHNWGQEDFQSSGSEAQLEMPQGMSWAKGIFHIQVHRAYRWQNIT